MQAHAAITVEDVSYSYNQKSVLKNISLSVPSGKMFGLLGPNGSGKSTFLHILSSLFKLQSGTVNVLGYDLKMQSHEIRKLMGVTFQTASLDKKLSVIENLSYHGLLYGLSGENLKNRISDVLQDFELTDYTLQTVEKLSGGFKRRVELAKISMIRPRLLLLDEPTTGLDPLARMGVWNQLKKMQTQGTTILFTTHLMEEAEHCDSLALFHQGKLVLSGTPLALKQKLQGLMVVIKTHSPLEVISRMEPLGARGLKVTDNDLRMSHDQPAELAGKCLKVCGDIIQEITLRYPSLEDVFFQATGSTLKESRV